MNQIYHIQQSILNTTGKEFEYYASKSRKTDRYFLRMIFAYECYLAQVDPKEIALMLKRDRSTIMLSIQKYSDEYKINPEFQKLANSVNLHLAHNSDRKSSPKTAKLGCQTHDCMKGDRLCPLWFRIA